MNKAVDVTYPDGYSRLMKKRKTEGEPARLRVRNGVRFTPVGIRSDPDFARALGIDIPKEIARRRRAFLKELFRRWSRILCVCLVVYTLYRLFEYACGPQ